MANEKILNTRVQLKYDSYTNWTTNNPTLLAGEIAIAKLVNDVTIPVDEQKNAPVLFKVGPGSFNDLPWASALAADVYAWAKETSLFVNGTEATTTVNGDKTYVGNAYTSVEWDSTLNEGKGGLKLVKGTQFATKAELDAALEAFGGDLDAITDNNTKYTFEIPASGDHAGKLAVTEINYVNGTAEGSGTTTYYDFITPAELETILANYYNKNEVDGLIQGVRDDIPAELGVMSVTGKEAVVATGDSEVEIGLTLDNSGNVVLSQSNTGLKATIDLSEYRKIVDDEDTKYGLTYDSDAKQIKIVPNGGESYIDASEFVVDGMLESVVADQTANTLTFTWNTDGGETVTTVTLSEIADIYTAAQNASEVQIAISNTNEVSASLVNASITEAKLAEAVTTKLNKVWEEVGVAQGLVDALAATHAADKAALEQAIESAKADASTKDAVVLAEAQKGIAEVQGNLTVHAEDTDIHVSTAEKEAWNQKLESVTAAQDGGLVATPNAETNSVSLAIDDSITWVFYCGSSTDVI